MRKFKRNIQKKQKKKIKPGFVQQQLGRANGFLQTGRFRDAELICREILAKHPRHAGVLCMLGSIALEVGNNVAALDLCRQAVAVDGTMENGHIIMGLAASNLGDYQGAVIHYLNGLRLNGSNALTHYNLGNVYKLLEDYPAAVHCYEAAIRLRPDYIKALNNLGNACRSLGELERAADCFRKTMELAPELLEAHNNLGSVLVVQGELERAEECFNHALEINKTDPVALAGLADIHAKKNNYETAYELIAPLVTEKGIGIDARVVNIFVDICSRVDRQREALDMVEVLLSGMDRYSPEEQRSLYFSFGRLFDELAMYDKAFEHYDRANRMKKVQFVADENLRQYQQIIQEYSSGRLADTSRIASHLPVFIVGFPRSGTSLVEQILASHPGVYGAGELRDVGQLVERLPGLLESDAGYPECERLLSGDQLDGLAKEYLAVLRQRADDGSVTRITDKMPGNFKYLGFIRRLFPEAIIIHCRRDPLDTCLSCFFQDFAGPHAYIYDLKMLGIAYRQYEYLMAFWRDEMKIPMFEVCYEDLIRDQGKVSRELVAYCGLEWDDGCLEFHKSDRVVHTASMHQVRKPIYTKSVERWRNYEQYLEPLKEGLEMPVLTGDGLENPAGQDGSG